MPRGRTRNPNRSEVRTERIEFRATTDEKSLLEEEAGASGIDLGAWLRALAIVVAGESRKRRLKK
jgi:hypothetical protein